MDWHVRDPSNFGARTGAKQNSRDRGGTQNRRLHLADPIFAEHSFWNARWDSTTKMTRNDKEPANNQDDQPLGMDGVIPVMLDNLKEVH